MTTTGHRHVCISVRLLDGRYHGNDAYPSPARLFQALVAGAAVGPLDARAEAALTWLEGLTPPVVAIPLMKPGQLVTTYVPNNDFDAVGADPARLSEIRAARVTIPRLFSHEVPFLYAWGFEVSPEDLGQAQSVCHLAGHLYQLGRGVDMAWATSEILANEDLDARLNTYPGPVYRPVDGEAPQSVTCPGRGSLQSLLERFAAGERKIIETGAGRTSLAHFSQAPKARFRQVSYEGQAFRRLFELHNVNGATLGRWPAAGVGKLVTSLRDAAAQRLSEAVPSYAIAAERVLVGRSGDQPRRIAPELRVQILPLPSIGHPEADHAIRRVLVVVPSGCGLVPDDVFWAFSGLDVYDPKTGEHAGLRMVVASDDGMLSHYGATPGVGHRVWRTKTPAVLFAQRDGIHGSLGRPSGRKTRLGGEARAAHLTTLNHAALQALRHAGIGNRVTSLSVQREPFDRNQARAEKFAMETRFDESSLWHVEVCFERPLVGPFCLGNGRFLGLGVMAPEWTGAGTYAFSVEGASAEPEALSLSESLRKAVMARAGDYLGRRKNLEAYFSAHAPDGSPARSERDGHLCFAWDPDQRRLLIVAPHVLARRAPRVDELLRLQALEGALEGFKILRAGRAGKLRLSRSSLDSLADPLFAPTCTWTSLTPYCINRHEKGVDARRALARDIGKECEVRGWPVPTVEVRNLRAILNLGLTGMVRLRFPNPVKGPIILGKTRYKGGGLFINAAKIQTSRHGGWARINI